MTTVKHTDSGIDPIIKDHYSEEYRLKLLYNKKNHLFNSLKRVSKGSQGLGGRKFIQPIQIARVGGVRATMAAARSDYSASKYEAFEVTPTKIYAMPQIDNLALEAAKTNADAFLPIIAELDNGWRGLGDTIEYRLYRDKGLTIGKIAASTTLGSTTAILTDYSDVHRFYPTQVVQLVTTRSGGAVRAGTLTVVSINRETPSVTFTGNITAGVAAAALGDFIVENGTYDTGAFGLEDWLPYDRSGLGVALAGVTRSVDPQVLAGCIVDGTGGKPIHETILEGMQKVDDVNGEVTEIHMHPRTFLAWTKANEGRIRIDRIDEKIDVRHGVGMFKVDFGQMTATVRSSRSVPSTRIFGLNLSTFCLRSAGEFPMWLLENNDNYGKIAVPDGNDGWEFPMGGYYNLTSEFPGSNFTAEI